MAANVQVVITLATADLSRAEQLATLLNQLGGVVYPSDAQEEAVAVVAAEVIRIYQGQVTFTSVSGGNAAAVAGGGGGGAGSAAVISHAKGCAPDHEHGWHGCLEPNCNCGVIRSNG